METFKEQIDLNKELVDNNPENFEANYGLANSYYYGAEEKYSAAEQLPDDDSAGRELLSDSGGKMLEDSMPYFEKANVLRPEDGEVVEKLKTVYVKLKLEQKVKGINERIID